MKFVDPLFAASYSFKRGEASAEARAELAPAARPTGRRMKHRIRQICASAAASARPRSSSPTMMSAANKADLPWVPYIYGKIHLARAERWSKVELRSSSSTNIDQAIGRFQRIRSSRKICRRGDRRPDGGFLAKGIVIHQTTPLNWNAGATYPALALQKRQASPTRPSPKRAAKLQQLPQGAESPASDAPGVSRLEGAADLSAVDDRRASADMKSGEFTVRRWAHAELGRTREGGASSTPRRKPRRPASASST